MHALKADTHRKFGQSTPQLTLKAALLDPAFRVVAAMRLCQAAEQLAPNVRWLAVWPARLLYRLVSQLAGIEIPWRTTIAPGLALTHGRGIVVNAGARIGSNVTLFHGVTLGQRDHIDAQGRRHTLYPVIEDEVWIGPHAIIVGGVTVGKGSRIAGGAYVFEDVPPYCVVLGNPGQIVRRDCTPDVANRYSEEALPVPQAGPAAAANAGINAG
ncbi:serine O-acetyltransferase [Polaromonas sp. YR568]|uniref:serine O-acetyltransferase n=1 Tax=Polaromonas sp. YR568 TaxID=1855301 RepID=UPI0008E9B8ED|nr:serine acetyltransferase [Polaromonas sp. YR568]SFU95611.1 serine O-acetyltransferase [Polaromonas sp. YR568]